MAYTIQLAQEQLRSLAHHLERTAFPYNPISQIRPEKGPVVTPSTIPTQIYSLFVI